MRAHGEEKLTICIVGCISMEIRGPQRFVIEFSKWLSRRSKKGIVISGSLKKFVKGIDINDTSMMTSEDEKSVLIRHPHSCIFRVARTKIILLGS